MRFAFKTAPQNTTWADMVALWRAGDDIDVFESGRTFDHFYPEIGALHHKWVKERRLPMGLDRHDHP